MLAVSHFSSGLGYRLDHIVHRLTRVLLVLVQAVLCSPLGILVSLDILLGLQATSQPTAPVAPHPRLPELSLGGLVLPAAIHPLS